MYKYFLINDGYTSKTDIRKLPSSFRKNYSHLFLPEDIPEELKTAYYTRNIKTQFLVDNPQYLKYLKEIDLEYIFPYMPLYSSNQNLIKILSDNLGREDSLDVLLLYGRYIEDIYNVNKLSKINLNSKFSKEELIIELDSVIHDSIISGRIKYDSNLSINNLKNILAELTLSQASESQ